MNDELHDLLCEQWCSEVDIGSDSVGTRLSLPLYEPDGDGVTVWVKKVLGGWELRDCGTTFMRLSYDMDVDLLLEGQRARVIERILAEHSVENIDGEIAGFAPEKELGTALLQFGQALTRIGDVKLWSRARVASTFYDDLRSTLIDIVGSNKLVIDYEVPGVIDSASYKVDYAVLTGLRPLYIFGVPNSDKAKLATIVLLHLQQDKQIFESLIVPSDIESIHKPDLRRLMNAASDFVDSSSSVEVLRRKITQRLT
jgi:hypothetical protein